MRLKSEFWVKAYLRRAAVGGCPGVVVRHGHDEAGAIFIKVILRSGEVLLFGPAPAGLDGVDEERRFVSPFKGGGAQSDAVVDAKLAEEVRFDSDLWVVEIESQSGEHFLDGWLFATPKG
jgi:hypothetical protein